MSQNMISLVKEFMGTLSDTASNTILKCEVLGFHSSD
jgi:hypothetical protein